MSRLSMAASLAASLALAAPAYADPVTDILSSAASSAAAGTAPAIKVFRKKNCGTQENLFFCGSFAASLGSIDANGSVTSPKMKVKAAKGSTVVVTWTGSVYCQSNLGFVINDVNYIVSMQIQNGKSKRIVYNDEGVNTVGRVAPNQIEPLAEGATFEELYPATLTRTFSITGGGEDDYFARFDVEMRNRSGFCNVNGGAMTALVIP
jgi:hypothetical protein